MTVHHVVVVNEAYPKGISVLLPHQVTPLVNSQKSTTYLCEHWMLPGIPVTTTPQGAKQETVVWDRTKNGQRECEPSWSLTGDTTTIKKSKEVLHLSFGE